MRTVKEMEQYLHDTAQNLSFISTEMGAQEMYRELIQMGSDLAPFPEELATEENKVSGCTSLVYVSASCADGRVTYQARADAVIVRGMVKILVDALSGLGPDDIVGRTKESIEDFAKTTKIQESLSYNRANSFGNVYAHMVRQAQHFTSNSVGKE